MSSRCRSSDVYLVVLGFAAAITQAILLREGMSAFAGSELAWSAVLSVWLVGMSIGARVGARHDLGRVTQLAPVAIVVLAAAGVLLLRAAPSLTAGGIGETAGGWRSTWLWISAVLPAALVGGWAFPALAASGRTRSPGCAYALEAAGACLGGLLFTFVLAPFGAATAILLSAAACLAPMFGARISRSVVVGALALCLAWPASGLLARWTWRWSGHPGTLGSWDETRHQRLEVSAEEPRALYSDGRLVSSYPDPWRTGVRGHLLMLLTPHPRNVLAVGAAADGMVETLARHPVSRIDLVEEDPALLHRLRQWYGPQFSQSIDDPAVRVTTEDPLRVLAGDGPWDLILLLDPPPISLRLHRTRSLGFFRRCAERLAPEGRLVVATGVSDTYTGGAGGRLLQILYSTLSAALPHVAAVPGDNVLLVAGHHTVDDVLDPEALRERWLVRSITDPAFAPEMIPALIDTERASTLGRTLEEGGSLPTTARHPRAVLPAAALAEGRGRAGVAGFVLSLDDARLSRSIPIFAVTLVVLAVLGSAHRRLAGEIAAAAVGFASMSWFVLLLAVWQSTRGSVYAEVGALVAAFMAGTAAAAGALGDTRKHRPPLWSVLLAGTALSAAIVGGVPLRWPMAVPALLALGGAATGAAFPGVAALVEGREPAQRVRQGTGRGFSADELGAAFGAAAVGLVFPLAGLGITAGAGGLLLLFASAAAIRHR